MEHEATFRALEETVFGQDDVLRQIAEELLFSNETPEVSGTESEEQLPDLFHELEEVLSGIGADSSRDATLSSSANNHSSTVVSLAEPSAVFVTSEFDLSYLETPPISSDSQDNTSSSDNPDSPDSVTVSANHHDSGQCKICDRPATKHSHYGAQACQSCRAFFRRSITKNPNPQFVCIKGSRDCQIDSKSWTSCKACRFSLCLKAGMQARWVFNTKEREEWKQKRLVKKRERSQNQIAKSDLKIIKTFTLENFLKLRADSLDFKTKFHNTQRDIVYSDKTIYQGYISAFDPSKNTMAEDPMLKIFFATNERYKEFLDPELDSLSTADRTLLESNNVQMVLELIFATAVQKIKKRDSAPKITNETVTEVENITDRLSDMKLCFEDEAPLQFDTLYGGFEPHQRQKLHFYVKALQESVMDNEGRYDTILMYLTSMVLLYNSEFLSFEERPKVERLQLKHISVLWDYVQYQYGGTKTHRTKFVQLLMNVNHIRETLNLLHELVNHMEQMAL